MPIERSRMRRPEINERVEGDHERMSEKGECISENVEDAETTRDTLDHLEGGTEEGFEETSQCIETAQDTSIEEFDGHSEELEQIHDESEEFEGELHESGETVGEDLERMSEAKSDLHSDAVSAEVARAVEHAEKDQELLREHEERAQQHREESRRRQEEHQARLDAARRS